MKIILSFLSMLTIAHASVGTKNSDGGLVGNGGGAVICYDPTATTRTITKTEVLDLYEARVINYQTLDPAILKTGDWKTIARSLIERMGKVSEMRRQLYGMYLDRFDEESKLLSNVNLGDVKDADYVAMPQGCKLEMVILQSKPRITGNARYYINESLWNALDDFNKAVLVMHELIYREALSYGHANSVRVRLLNGYLLSTELLSLAQTNTRELVSLFQRLNFEYLDVPFIQMPTDLEFNAPMNVFWSIENSNNLNPEFYIKLKNRIILKIGQCSADSCKNYENLVSVRAYMNDYYVSDVELMDLSFDLNVVDNIHSHVAEKDSIGIQFSYSPEGEWVRFTNQKYNKVTKSYEDSNGFLTYIEFTGKLKEHLQIKYVDYPSGVTNVHELSYSNDYQRFEFSTKADIYYSTNNLNQNYLIDSAHAYKESVLRFIIDDLNRSNPKYECTLGECSLNLSVSRNSGDPMMEVIFSKDDQGIFLNSKGQYLTGGRLNAIYGTDHTLECINEGEIIDLNKDCLSFVRDPVTSEIIMKNEKLILLTRLITTGAVNKTEKIVKVRPGIYPLYSTFNAKWVIIGDDSVYSDCSNYFPSGSFANVLHAGDILYFKEDGSPDVYKSCALKQNSLQQLIRSTSTQYLNALKGAGI